MKVAIFGSYNGTSVGDTAILLGLLRAIGLAQADARITVMSMGPIDITRDLSLVGIPIQPRQIRVNAWGFQELPLLRSLLWRIDRWVHFSRWLGRINIGRCRAILEKQDVLIIGGGNLLMDLFEGHVETLRSVCDLARAVHVPYALVGVGAGPIRSDESRRSLADCVTHARRVVVRDAASLRICRDTLSRGDTLRAPDPAFALQGVARDRQDRRALALNVASFGDETWPWRDEARYRAYVDGFVRLARAAVQRFNPDHVEIISTNMSVDHRATQEVAAALGRGSAALNCPVSIVACVDVSEAIAAFSQADLAITTRLHAGIIASIAGCRVLPVAYEDKVREVLEGEKISRFAVDLARLVDPAWNPGSMLDALAIEPEQTGRAIAPEIIAAVSEVLKCR